MDNYDIPPSVPPVQPSQPMMASNPGMPMIQQVQAPISPKKDIAGLIKTIAIIVLSLIAATFIGLFIWMTIQYNEAHTNVQGQIDVAVAEAKDEQATKLEAEFLEREKYPYKTFTGPVDYGQLSFQYPKTWSVYIEQAATTGGDFRAYFNPNQVNAVGRDTVNALRVTILNRSFEDVTAEYQRQLTGNDPALTMQSLTFNGVSGNRYAGKIPGTDLNGFIVIFKIRDKSVILQTDSVLFESDFNKLVDTVTFNE